MFAIPGTNDRHFYSGPAKNTADEGSVWGENGVFLPHPQPAVSRHCGTSTNISLRLKHQFRANRAAGSDVLLQETQDWIARENILPEKYFK